MDDPYSKRELDTHFAEIKEYLVGIDQKVGETNGRVRKLEMWRATILGGLVVIMSIVIPLAIYAYNSDRISTASAIITK